MDIITSYIEKYIYGEQDDIPKTYIKVPSRKLIVPNPKHKLFAEKKTRAPRKFKAPQDKNDKYWRYRSKNTEAARQSRAIAKMKEQKLMLDLQMLKQHNRHLKLTIKELTTIRNGLIKKVNAR